MEVEFITGYENVVEVPGGKVWTTVWTGIVPDVPFIIHASALFKGGGGLRRGLKVRAGSDEGTPSDHLEDMDTGMMIAHVGWETAEINVPLDGGISGENAPMDIQAWSDSSDEIEAVLQIRIVT